MNDEPTVEHTDDPEGGPSRTEQEPSANHGDGKAAGRDLGTFVTAVSEAVQEIAREIAERARPAVRDASAKARPVMREASARAADVAAKAADAAGPIAQKVAVRSREIATDLRRAEGAQGETNGHGAPGGVATADPLPPVVSTADTAEDATRN